MVKKLARLTFDFFASLKLAVFLLIALAVTLAAGTILESVHGAKAAQQVVYHSAWFNLLLGVLGISVAAAALDRLPWQRKHIGFLLTHAGILLILLGSWMTQRFAIEGELALAEGEKGGKITLEEPLLQIVLPGTDQGVIVPVKPTPFQWEGKRPISLPGIAGLRAYLTAYYPHSEPVGRVLPKHGGKPAARVVLFNNMTARTSPARERGETGGWLLLGVQDHDSVDMGPAVIRFSAQPFEGERMQDFKGALILQYNGKEFFLPVKDVLAKPWPVPDTSYTLEVKRFLPHAVVEKSQLINQSDAPVNPACELVLRGNGLEEFHTVFARFPDFPTIHGLKPSRTGIKIRYDFPEETVSLNELRLLQGAEGKLFYQIKTQGIPGPQIALEPGKEYSTGWMNLKFAVTDYYEEAQYETGFDPRPMPAQGKAPNPAARIEFQKGKDSHSAWFTRGDHQIFFLDGQPFHVTCGLRSLPLDFDIELKDFMIDYYPGTERPASFKSNVVLEDPSRGLTRSTLISMNKPLEHRGFKIYQSGYQLSPGEPDISVFAVGRDPGVPVKYAGSIVMILGIVTMFYMKKFSNPRSFYAES